MKKEEISRKTIVELFNFAKAKRKENKILIKHINIYREFVMAWERCESTRGCYSCSDNHDCRCSINSGKKCSCGRNKIEAIYKKITDAEQDLKDLGWVK